MWYICLGCPDDDTTCQKDKIGFDAIGQLHSQIDDNHDGGLNWAESDEVSQLYSIQPFLRLTSLNPRRF